MEIYDWHGSRLGSTLLGGPPIGNTNEVIDVILSVLRQEGSAGTRAEFFQLTRPIPWYGYTTSRRYQLTQLDNAYRINGRCLAYDTMSRALIILKATHIDRIQSQPHKLYTPIEPLGKRGSSPRLQQFQRVLEKLIPLFISLSILIWQSETGPREPDEHVIPTNGFPWRVIEPDQSVLYHLAMYSPSP